MRTVHSSYHRRGRPRRRPDRSLPGGTRRQRQSPHDGRALLATPYALLTEPDASRTCPAEGRLAAPAACGGLWPAGPEDPPQFSRGRGDRSGMRKRVAEQAAQQ
jgi:hypothetical protein